jgi:site-specific DNA recombinase
MQPEAVKEFVAEYHRELNRTRMDQSDQHAREVAELEKVERQIRAIIEAIKDGLRTPGMKDELIALEEQKEQLARRVEHAPAPAPLLHPSLAELYRKGGGAC